jgi:hypothetical protein
VGGSWLRSGALSDDDVIDLINAKLVPVWIDVRTESLPPLPPGTISSRIELDANRRVVKPLQEGFFLRSLVLSSDGKVVLNLQDDSPEGARASMRDHGYFSYAQVKAIDYLPMLRDAIARNSPPAAP